jgi:hypothetical protein
MFVMHRWFGVRGVSVANMVESIKFSCCTSREHR